MIRAVVVDDEEPARERLRHLLQAIPDVAVVGEAGDGEQAIERILELKPDVIFLDIQMPGCNGLDVVASLRRPRPKIIFCTAFDQYAVDAFELHACDYLLKPVSRARLEKAVARLGTRTAEDADAAVEGARCSAARYPTRFLAKVGSRYSVIPRHDVLYFASEGGITKIQTAPQHYWMEPTLNELEERVDPMKFFRISRAAIVNLDAVREVVPLLGGSGEARLVNGTRLEVSRRRLKALMDRLAEA